MSLSKVDEREKQAALEEEQARLQALKANDAIPRGLLIQEQRHKEIPMQPQSATASTTVSPSSTSGKSINTSTAVDLFAVATPVSSTNSAPSLSNDIFNMQSAFVPTVQSTPAISTSANAWGDVFNSFAEPSPATSTKIEHFPEADMFDAGFAPQAVPQMIAPTAMNVDFDSVFGAKLGANDAQNASGEMLMPTLLAKNQTTPAVNQQNNKLLATDLDSSLANLVGNLNFGGTPMKKMDQQWIQSGERKLTGGSNWQPKTAASTSWSATQMNVPPMVPPPISFPVSTPQVPVYGMVPGMGTVPVVAQQPMMYPQTVMRATNPFAPVNGAQLQFM